MGKKERYEVCQVWASLLPHRRTPCDQNGRFNFHESLKWYLRNITKGEIVDDDTVPDAIEVDPDNFVKFVVRHLGEVF